MYAFKELHSELIVLSSDVHQIFHYHMNEQAQLHQCSQSERRAKIMYQNKGIIPPQLSVKAIGMTTKSFKAKNTTFSYFIEHFHIKHGSSSADSDVEKKIDPDLKGQYISSAKHYPMLMDFFLCCAYSVPNCKLFQLRLKLRPRLDCRNSKERYRNRKMEERK